MRAITIWQPYASLIFAGRKRFETRHWTYPVSMAGEVLALHAAKKPVPRDRYGEEVDAICTAAFGSDWPSTLPRSAVLGTVRLVGCHSMATMPPPTDGERAVGYWAPDRFAWELGDITPFAAPVPAAGKQGWWTWEGRDHG